MDVLDDILASLRLSGGVVFDASTTGDWCIVAQFGPEDCAPFFPPPGQVISYHFVRDGKIWARIGTGDPVELNPGDLVLFPRNDAHLLFTRADLTPVDVAQYIRPAPGSGDVNAIVMDFGGRPAGCYCGWLGVQSGDHPLLNALPPMLVVRAADYAAEWVEASLNVAAGQWSANPALVARLSELVFAQAVRRFIEDQGDGSDGWLAGLADPAVARALAVIHARYADELDVDLLAREAGVSRTILGERFARTLGEPPMRYCARWRLRVAAGHLLDGRTTAVVAHAVGFASEAAFNRAFKRGYGQPPAAWTRQMRSESASVAA